MRYEELGASLYVPATRGDLAAILSGRRFDGLRSLILCTEDAVSDEHLGEALSNVEALLPDLYAVDLPVFVRVRNLDILNNLLRKPHIGHLAGVVLPKFDGSNATAYLDALVAHPELLIMPTLETRDVFSVSAMEALRDTILAHPVRSRILAMRIGGNDLMALLGIRRPHAKTIYETLLGPVISQLVTTFRPYDLPLTAPVCDAYSTLSILEQEVEQDLMNGLLSKTAIHPNQVSTIQALYAVSEADLAIAHKLILPGQKAIFGHDGVMHERTTHMAWARSVVGRAALFGTQEEQAVTADSDARYTSGNEVARLLKESG
ncbi:MAG: HpcH/HpaI aldolase/citrate lyase family protein [Bradymonadia bacterium]